jgi:hypothetical protein
MPPMRLPPLPEDAQHLVPRQRLNLARWGALGYRPVVACGCPGRRRGVRVRCWHRHIGTGWADHLALWRRGRAGPYVATAQLYEWTAEDELAVLTDSGTYGLSYAALPPCRSWHYPGWTWCIVVGAPAELARIAR